MGGVVSEGYHPVARPYRLARKPERDPLRQHLISDPSLWRGTPASIGMPIGRGAAELPASCAQSESNVPILAGQRPAMARAAAR